MTAFLADWFGLLRWRWWRGATVEVARRLRLRADLPIDEADLQVLQQRMFDIQRAAHWVPRSRCLDRALRLLDVADQLSIPASLRLGVLRDGAVVKAHAWVCVGDLVLDPDPLATARYLPMQHSAHPAEFDR